MRSIMPQAQGRRDRSATGVTSIPDEETGVSPVNLLECRAFII